jgi:hypothetical protein
MQNKPSKSSKPRKSAVKEARAKSIIAVDCETDPFKHDRVPKPFIWGAIKDGLYYGPWRRTEDFVEWLKDQDAIAYAHNGGKFDWHFLLDYLNKNEPIVSINGRLAKAKLGICELRDSWNLFNFSLQHTGEKMKFDYALMEEDVREDYMDEIAEYLKQDCVALYNLVIGFRDEYAPTGKMPLTQASAAMTFWEKLTGEREKTDLDYYTRFGPFYYGGRTEAFQKGEFKYPLQYVDINSAYPYAMTFEHPAGQPHFGEWDGKDGAAMLQIEAEARGIFPFRQKDGSLSFPDDFSIREFFVTGWEAILYQELYPGRHFEVIECYRWARKRDFKEYVAKFWELKARSTGNTRTFAKLFLNSLYGKFAANPLEYEESMLVDAGFNEEKMAEGWTPQPLTPNTWAIFKPLKEDKQRYYNVATAASVTGFVRAMLAREIKRADTVIYCDTDSLICQGFKGPMGKGLGEWDLEARFDYGCVAGKKLYAFHMEEPDEKGNEWKTASKGTRLRETPEKIFSVARGEKVEYKNPAPTFSLKNEARFVTREIRMT